MNDRFLTNQGAPNISVYLSKNYFKGYDSLVYNQNRILQDLLIFSCDLFQINILLEDIFFPCLEEMKKIILNNASIKFNSY